MPIKNWSTTAASNNSAPPNGWPENQAPSTVNDCARQMMADIRSQCETAEWFDYGDTISRLSATTFQIATDVTAKYSAQRRFKAFDASTLYGTVLSSSYSAPNTTITVGLDSGSLTASLSSIALSVISPSNLSIPSTIGRKGADIASAATADIASATADFVDVTGTTTITALGTANAGVERTIRFTGALTLTHNATSLILPSGANITTANGDTAVFRSLGSGNWVCISYQKTTGKAVLSNYELITTATASASATIDFTGLSSTYSFYVIEINDLVPATDGASLYLRTSEDNGSTFDATNGNYHYAYHTFCSDIAFTETRSNNAAQIQISDTIGNATEERASGLIWLFYPATTNAFGISFKMSRLDTGSQFREDNGGGARMGVTAGINAVRLLMSAGNITSGTFRLYGVRAS